MKFLKLDLLTLLISLFILGSCKNPDSIGLGIDPSKAIQANLIDSTTINTTTALDDSILTSNITTAPLAFFKDPILGTTEANIATAVNLPGDAAFTPITDPVIIDSAVLVLQYAKGFYGDITTVFTANVYQLQNPLVSSQNYYNNKAYDVLPNNTSPTILGTKLFTASPNDSTFIRTIVVGGPDTLVKSAPQLRIPISKSFINTNFFQASSSALATNQIFQNAIKGLLITLNKTAANTSHPGGTLFFDMGTTPRIDIYYRIIHPVASPDTILSSLTLGFPHAVQIKHDYTINTDITNQLNPLNKPTASFPNVYLQGLSGLRAKIGFPYLTAARLLHNLRKSSFAANPAVDTTKIIDFGINQAELRITSVMGTGIPFAPLPRLTLYRFDIAHQRALIPDALSTDPRYLSLGSFGGFFDSYPSHQSYSFIITGYVDDLLRGKLKDYGTFIAPADTTGLSTGASTIDINNSAQFDGRSVVGGNSTSAYKMKLNILYNKVTK